MVVVADLQVGEMTDVGGEELAVGVVRAEFGGEPRPEAIRGPGSAHRALPAGDQEIRRLPAIGELHRHAESRRHVQGAGIRG